MSRPFNFYQYGETGAGNYVTPFPSHFSGFYIPPGVLEGGEVGFIIRTSDDDSLRPTSFSIAVTGSHPPVQNLTAQYYTQISGNLFPVSSDSGNLSFQITGQFEQFPYDNPTFDVYFSGQQSQDNTDLGYFYVGINADYEAGQNLINNYSFAISGSFAPILNNENNFTASFSGRVKDTPLDRASINLVFSSVVFGTGAQYINYAASDQATVSVEWAKILFSPA